MSENVIYRFVVLSVLLLLILQVKGYADWGFPEEDDVVMLDIYNHDKFLNEYEETMVYYFIDDCKHCKEFKPIYSKLALEFKESKKRIPLAQFDCNEHRNFCHEKLIPVYPFVKFYVKGHPVIYTGKREYEPIKKYVKFMMNRKPLKSKLVDFWELHDEFYNPKEIDTSLFTGAELKAEIKERNRRANTVMGVYFGKKTKNKKLYHNFDLYQKFNHNVQFFHVKEIPKMHNSNMKVMGDILSEGNSLNGKVILFYQDRSIVYKGQPNFDLLETFVHEIKYPRITFLDKALYNQLGSDRMTMVILFIDKQKNSFVKQFSRLANHFVKRLRFVVVADDSEHGEMVNEFKDLFMKLESNNDDDYDLKNNPQLRVVKISFSTITAEKYIMRDNFSFDTGLNFLVDFESKKIKRFLKSETLKEEFYKEGYKLKHINSDMFDSLVKIPGKTSMVLYHEGLEDNRHATLFADYLAELSNVPKLQHINFYAINADKNEIKDFYDDERPVLLCYSAKNIHSPLIYNKRFDKLQILKLIGKATNVKSPEEELEKIIYQKK